jgi:serine/threonine protein kinase
VTAERFGRYEVLERVETFGGGFDAIARGTDGREVRLWAGSAGSGAPAPDRPTPDRVRETLAGIYQAGLPRVLGAEVVEGRAVFVVQPYRGELLSERVQSAPLEPMEAIDHVRAVAAALVKAHRAGVVHGAISAGEILLADDGRTLLLHLGLAPFAGGVDPPGASATEAVDVFALAGVLHRCLVGAEAAPHPTAESLPPHLPEGLRRLLARALHADPARRMRRAEELSGDLAVIRASWAPPGPARRSREGRAAALAAGAAVGAVVVLVLATRSC